MRGARHRAVQIVKSSNMVILRATQKVLRHLPKSSEPSESSDTALGDWYVNRTVIDRVPLLILVSERSLLPMVIRARDVRSLPERLPELVADRLRRVEGVTERQADAEVGAMPPVVVTKTANRSVVGVLVECAYHAASYVGPLRLDVTELHVIESRLEEVPWFAGQRREDVVFASDKTRELLREWWGAG